MHPFYIYIFFSTNARFRIIASTLICCLFIVEMLHDLFAFLLLKYFLFITLCKGISFQNFSFYGIPYLKKEKEKRHVGLSLTSLVLSRVLLPLAFSQGEKKNRMFFSQMGCRICQSHCHSFGIPNSLPLFCSPFYLLIFFKTILNFVIHFHSLQRWQHICSGVVPILFSFPSGTESVCANASQGFGCGFVL